jgi:hypothetical protein
VKNWLVIFLVGLCTTLSAQVEKGRYFVGGSVDISAAYTGKNSSFNMSLTPQFAAFVVKGLAIGGRYSFGISSARNFDNAKQEYVSVTTFSSGIGPLIKYYPGKKPLKGLISVNANYLTSTTLRKNNVSGTAGFNFTGLVGIAYFLNNHLGIESGIYYTATSFAKQLTTTRIGFSVGIFAFLNNKKPEKPLSGGTN